MVERREFRRHRVGGNVEFTSVLGAGVVPDARATLLDCSLGGARLRVHSPRRRLFKKLDPCLVARDSVTCVMRLAPDYAKIDVFAEVVRVQRLEAEPDFLDVGLRFFHDAARRSHAERPMAKLARIIEPDWSAEQAAALAAAAPPPCPSRRLEAARAESAPGAEAKPIETPVARPASAPTPSVAPPKPAAPDAQDGAPEASAAGRAGARSARHGQRLSRLDDAAGGSGADRASSQRLGRATSARRTPPASPGSSQRLEHPTSGRQGAPTGARASQRLERATSGRQGAPTSSRRSQRLERASSGRLEQPASSDGAPRQGDARAGLGLTRAGAESARVSRRLAPVSDEPVTGRQAERQADARDAGASKPRVSGRLAGVRLDAEQPPPPRALSSDSEVVAWASSRLTAVAPEPAERVATADDEVTVRGSAQLTKGQAVIELPGAFTALARDAGLTAHVTPTADCGGLFVSERSPARLVVRELGGGRGAATFDYLVVATRRA